LLAVSALALLRLGNDHRGNLLKKAAWLRGCSDVYRLVAN
jgi:hypothetical protein